MTIENKEAKIEYVIKNWKKKTVPEMAIELKVAPDTISQWVTRLRKLGVDISQKRRPIKWDYLQKKYAKKNNQRYEKQT